MTTHYEWVIEELDGPDVGDDVEIIDVTHAPTYAEALKFAAQHQHARIGLVRDCDRDGYSHRSWAYVEDGKLADHLSDASGSYVVATPGIYQRQFEKAI